MEDKEGRGGRIDNNRRENEEQIFCVNWKGWMEQGGGGTQEEYKIILGLQKGQRKE